MVDPIFAPGFFPIEEGRNELFGGNPILHTVDWRRSRIINATMEGHWFHKGTVTHAFSRENGSLYMTTIGVGGNSGALNRALNAIVFYQYFGAMHIGSRQAVMSIAIAVELGGK